MPEGNYDRDDNQAYNRNYNQDNNNNGRSFTFGTTGGAGGPTVTPTTQAELISYLSGNTARTIVLTKIFDFTTYYGSATGTACKPYVCTNGATPQMLLNTNAGGCDGKTLYSVSYYNSGQNKGLSVGSNKTILGKGSDAGLLQISIHIGGSSKVWIDHCYFARLGRQFIVTGFDPNSAVTISNNFFDGRSSYSVSCNGMHYWALIFAGTSDQITFIDNRIYYTSGRGPHAGAGSAAGNAALVHIVNNYYDTVGGHAIDNGQGSVILTEGNYFKSVTKPDTGTSSGGTQYFVQTVADAGACSSPLGRVCEWNRLDSSGAVAARTTASVLTTFGGHPPVKSLKPRAVADVPAYVLANSGVGIVN
ncbi:hypothetical protein FRC01_011492 [Tulasnella sp. 417]|nr:hypothetical protein FRC01_011492 [Tulasnella sp. 417]